MFMALQTKKTKPYPMNSTNVRSDILYFMHCDMWTMHIGNAVLTLMRGLCVHVILFLLTDWLQSVIISYDV